MYGIGSYVHSNFNSFVGYMVSIFLYVLILIFYAIDLLYIKEFKVKINGVFYIMVAFLVSSIGALFLALSKHPPFLNELYTYTKSVVITLPFFAFIAVVLYNERKPEKLAKLTFESLNILLFINVVGYYALGLRNGTHNIEGRLSMPFIDGMYSGACLVAIVNLMVVYYLKKTANDPFRFAYLLVYFCLNSFFLKCM